MSACIVGFRGIGESTFNRDDLAVGNTDVNGLWRWPIWQSNITYN